MDINGDTHSGLDESLRETGLSALRAANNARVLDRLAQLGLRDGARVLDVGSAHGWFVRAAVERGWRAEGLEPDDAIAARSAGAGATVRHGFFPDALSDDETFDAICFNDVLEHLPDVRGAVAACRRHLRPDGLVSINIPSTRGVVFTLGRWMDRAGSHRLSDRLWQVGFPSPHLWYFDPVGLAQLCEVEDLEPVLVESLPSVVRRGLWERAHEGGRPTPLTVTGVAAAWLAAPLLNHDRTSDIMHVVARKRA
ncbi:class I SAM-dependent methyltransferase [Rhodococcus antarcticus]|uniref:Class I SAM-dependent methyltransferase n=1 Tax=Rhodococcus antarcticus TaxID=2987751 RepID=A0ABY6NYS3_9NOCA|nr:class I SAM-dependent methyltransferase [Rhodococcus antarcticus]UZJ24549.1 class I SAM-dependent methyltransferase [Rhodococcus antarcticus]